MIYLIVWFVKLTSYIPGYIVYRKKVHYVNKHVKRHKGGALLVSNHKSIYDFPLIMFSFYWRTIKTVISKELYNKRLILKLLLKGMGGIEVDRQSYDFSFTGKMIKWMKKGKYGLIFPEARIPRPEERGDLIEFKPSYIYLALEAGVPIIPMYTNGIYGPAKRRKFKDRARLVIGEAIDPRDLLSDERTDKENIDFINNYIKDYIRQLGNSLKSK